MTGRAPGPPPFRRIAALLLRGPRGDVILGDLEEGYHRRLQDGASRAAAARWFIVMTVRSAIAAARHPASGARRSGRPMAALIRDAVRAYLGETRVPEPPGAGAFSSGHLDTAEHTDAVLRESSFGESD